MPATSSLYVTPFWSILCAAGMPNHDLELACWLATIKRMFLRSAAFRISSRPKRNHLLVVAPMRCSELERNIPQNVRMGCELLVYESREN